MRSIILAICLLPLLSAQRLAPTLRVDYFHTGDATGEKFALDGVVFEGDWPGRPDATLDDTNLGKYFFVVLDRKTSRPLYSRGFATIYGEWETTDEAKKMTRTFHESVRFPAPAAPVQLVLKKRDRQNAFREIWSVVIDPAAQSVDRTARNAAGVWAVMKNGEPRDKVDILLMGDGYTAAEMEKWHKDARRLTETLFSVSPFKERRSSFNVSAVDTPADESGVARPSDGVWRRSPLRASYDAFGSERYVLTFDNKRMARPESTLFQRMVRPERRVVLAGESPVRVSAGAPGSRLQPGGEIRPSRAECRKPLKERGANQRAATIK